jgi:hypothetical protein
VALTIQLYQQIPPGRCGAFCQSKVNRLVLGTLTLR